MWSWWKVCGVAAFLLVALAALRELELASAEWRITFETPSRKIVVASPQAEPSAIGCASTENTTDSATTGAEPTREATGAEPTREVLPPLSLPPIKSIGWRTCLLVKFRQKCTDWKRDDESRIPCRAELLYDIITSVDQALTEGGIPHWMAFGTLLGARRNGTVIPWTGDADLLYTGPNGQSNFSQLVKAARDSLYRRGFLLFQDRHPRDKDYGRVCIGPHSEKYSKFRTVLTDEHIHYTDRFPMMDLFPARLNPEDGLYATSIFRCKYKEATVFPLSTIRFYDTTIAAPAKVDNYLSSTYGPNFMFPPVNKSAHGDRYRTCHAAWRI
eukprot:TRINITY_DN6534_c0_g1_i1.p1 TRINITY_DN6534_c0_g1~~TRINITY_DN6534_c0_g1_i1.p1  ORF type:complete len:328 (+),score=1.98 TRINITY_DN6534_c0_g1_i1:44-1027(+)